MTDNTLDHAIASTRSLQWVALEHIHFNPWQMWPIDPEHVAELSADIQRNGVLQPPLAREHPQKPGEYQLAFGHHRRAAVAALGETSMVIEVRELTDLELADFAISENFSRKPPGTADKIRALQRLTGAPFKLSHAEAGRRFGLTDSAVSNLLRIGRLPEPVQALVDSQALPQRLARALVPLAAVVPAKELEAQAKRIASVSPDRREDAYEASLSDMLQEHGADLRDVCFQMEWKPTIIGPGPEIAPFVRACAGCEHLVRFEYNRYCTRPACAEWKAQHAGGELLAARVAKLGLAALAADEAERARPVVGNADYASEKHVPALVKAGKTDASLGLRLRLAGPDSGGYRNRQQTGNEYVELVTVSPNAVKSWLANAGKGTGKGKAVTVESNGASGPQATLKPTAKQLAAEKAEQEAGRVERARRWRLQADARWLIETVSEWAAKTMKMDDQIALYVIEKLSSRGLGGNYGSWPVVEEWVKDQHAQQRAAAESGARLWGHLARQRFIVRELGHAMPFGGPVSADKWDELVENITERVGVGDRENEQIGLGIKLLAGWNRPPIHQTDHNCWTCGTFTGNTVRRLAEHELEAGWTLEAQGDQVTRVTCPDCRGRLTVALADKRGDVSTDKPKTKKPAAKAPAKKGGKR